MQRSSGRRSSSSSSSSSRGELIIISAEAVCGAHLRRLPNLEAQRVVRSRDGYLRPVAPLHKQARALWRVDARAALLFQPEGRDEAWTQKGVLGWGGSYRRARASTATAAAACCAM